MGSPFKGGNGSFMFNADKPHFFKIILQETIADGKLVSVPFFPLDFSRKSIAKGEKERNFRHLTCKCCNLCHASRSI
jgi:hypothetical protein